MPDHPTGGGLERVSAAEHTRAMRLHTARRTESSASSSTVIPARSLVRQSRQGGCGQNTIATWPRSVINVGRRLAINIRLRGMQLAGVMQVSAVATDAVRGAVLGF